jgi:hypothetical protein
MPYFMIRAWGEKTVAQPTVFPPTETHSYTGSVWEEYRLPYTCNTIYKFGFHIYYQPLRLIVN